MFTSSTRKTSNTAAPQPTCFSPQQMSSYLSDLRTNRPSRPTGARPLPPSFGRKSTIRSPASPDLSAFPPQRPDGTVNARVPSERQQSPIKQRNVSGGSTTSTRSVSLFNEKDERQKQERKVSHEVSMALKKLDLEAQEDPVDRAAREEADELIRRHQNPSAAYRPAPLASMGRTSLGRRADRGRSIDEVLAEDTAAHSPPAGQLPGVQPPQRDQDNAATRSPIPTGTGSLRMGKQRSPSKFDPFSISNLANRRRSSGSKRLASGGSVKSIFVNPEDKIYEDPCDRVPEAKPVENDVPEPAEVSILPAHVRRNPFARMRSKRDAPVPPQESGVSSVSSRLSRAERQNSLPSQARDAGYTSSPPTSPEKPTSPLSTTSAASEGSRYRDGMEVRSDELRAATSMRMKDRSPKLPSPTAVSDSPGRPIVSFKPDWSPPELDEPAREPERAAPMTIVKVKTGILPVDIVKRQDHFKRASLELPEVRKVSLPPSTKPQEVFEMPFIKVTDASEAKASTIGAVQSSHSGREAFTPHKQLADDIPIFTVTSDEQVSQTPSISITPDEPSPAESSVSMSNFPAPPAISITSDAPSTTHNSNATPRAQPQLPSQTRLPWNSNPAPTTSPSQYQSHVRPHPHSRPLPRSIPTGLPAHHTPIKSPTATCSTCTLPISGRVVHALSLLFHPSCFTCHHCANPLEHVSFYPEPSASRLARSERIHARLRALEFPDEVYHTDGRSEEEEQELLAQDGWNAEEVRFYCHLDYHDLFSPRCKHCATPILGETITALGASWHVGHFFCAECGDPFDSSTPFVEAEGYAWCVGCHAKRVAPTCRRQRCGRKVGIGGNEGGVEALGGVWCAGCFGCEECGGSLLAGGDGEGEEGEGGRFYVRRVTRVERGREREVEVPVCEGCEGRRLKGWVPGGGGAERGVGGEIEGGFI